MGVLKKRFAAWSLLFVVCWVNLVSYVPWRRDAHLGAGGDAVEYFQMSQRTFAPVDNPFALRVLSPWLVHTGHRLTGLSPDTVWIALTFTATLASVIVLHELLRRRFAVSGFVAVVVASMLACTFWYAPYLFGNPWLVDPLNNLFIVLGLWLAFSGRLGWFTAVVVIGSVNKETMLLLAPLYPLLALTRSRRVTREVLLGTAAVAFAACAYFAFRTWAIARIGADYNLGTGQANHSLVDNIRFAISTAQGRDHLAIWSVLSFTWLIWLVGLHHLRRTGAGHPLIPTSAWTLLTCLLGRLMATDTERVFTMMVPIVLIVVAVTLDTLQSPWHRPWIVLLAALYTAIQLRWTSATLPMEALALLIFTALFTPWHRLRHSTPPGAISPPIPTQDREPQHDHA
ncbi:hypothetical protein [Actinokineospora terrae]|uniref:hypothetical protein n=1 Tax=Actinokineospora terrae TaxID=155974 RepID=UPI000B80F704|nr:hypothetical protein [Actinokineospora terrae]